MLGQCYEQLGDLDARYAAFRRAVALDPSGIPGRLGLAATLAAMGRLDDAIASYRRIIDEEPRVGPNTARLMILRNLQRTAGERDWREVDQVLDKSSRAMPGSTEIAILRLKRSPPKVSRIEPANSWNGQGMSGQRRSSSGSR